MLGQAPPEGFALRTGPRIAKALGDIHVLCVWRLLRAQKIDLAEGKLWCQSNDREPAAKAARMGVIVYRKRVAEFAKLMPERKSRDMHKYVQAPMPGPLRSLTVEDGNGVSAGAELGTLEAMKMENT